MPWSVKRGTFLPMSREVIIGAIVILAIVGSALWYGLTQPSTPPPSYSGEIIEESEFYSIRVAYPTTTPLRVSAGIEKDEAAVAFLKTEVESGVQAFKANTDPSTLSEEERAVMGLGSSRKYTLEINYEATTSPTTLSYILFAYEDTLGAHPNANYITETFELKSGARLTLRELFAFGADYLGILSTLARAKLPLQIASAGNIPIEAVNMAYIEAGTEPTELNFQNFYLSDDTFTMLFPPYQVGPWALGLQSVSVPRSELTHLKPEYR